MKTYSLVYKNYTNNSNSRVVKDQQILMLQSNCLVCGNKKNTFTSKGSGVLDSLGLNTPQNRMKNPLWNAFRELSSYSHRSLEYYLIYNNSQNI